jgi:tRNA nucleotidyltransferase (CCA-adding enzyme)
MVNNFEISNAMIIKLENELPPMPKFVEGIRRAPKRPLNLSKNEIELALSNALRYIPESLHEKLAPEFLEELFNRGRIYGYRYRPEGNIKAKPIKEYQGKYLEKVTGMRLREEFEKILNEPEPLKALERMGNLNIISHLFEKTYYTPTLQKELEKLFQVIDFFNNNLKSYTKNVRIFHVVLYVLVQYTPVESLKRVVQRYGLPKDYVNKLQQVNSLYEEVNNIIKESFGKQYKDIFKPSFFYERCSSLDNEQLIFMATKIPDDILSYFYNYLKKLDELTLLISGKDLLKKGYKGKEIKIKLEEIKKKLLDDEIKPGEELSLI